jgi:hypothetical protein
MKKYLLSLFVTLFFSSLILPVKAHDNDPSDPLAEKSKSYSKSYPIGSSDFVTLNNQFGELKINTWTKNEIKVDVVITAKAKTDEAAQRILDNIYVDDSKDGNEIEFKTRMKNEKMNWNNGNEKNYKEMSMSINYVVYMPATTPLHATNQFGPMSVPDFKGPVTLVSKFGSLTTGNLSNVKEVNVEFGEAWIDAINGGRVVVKFSRGSIKSMSGTVEARFEFCDKMRINVDNNVRDLNVRSSYSNLYINTATNLSSAINVKTSFGDFTNKTNFDLKKQGNDDDKYGPKFDKLYNGNAGAGANKLKVTADFGDVIMGHNLDVDFTSKKKQAKI